MKWIKKGTIYKPSGDLWWAKSHAAIPTPIVLNDTIIRIYISCRDENNISRVGYIDVDGENPEKIIHLNEEPVLDIGIAGCFDDNGVVATSICKVDVNTYYMYYVGFEICHNIRYRLFTGLAISEDGGTSFNRALDTPILERSDSELFFRCGPFVKIENNIYNMWYVGGSKWIQINNKEMPVYEIKHIRSKDGINWPNQSTTCIKISDKDEHGFGRPYVFNYKNQTRMFYSVRRISSGGYRMGYANLNSSLNWEREDSQIGLDISRADGLASEAIMYLSVISSCGKTYGFYNGNNFGETGIGLAELVDW